MKSLARHEFCDIMVKNEIKEVNMKTMIRLMVAITLSILFENALFADTYSTTPSDAWTTSGDTVVFDGSADGTLDSTTDTQSTSTSAGLSGSVTLEKKGSGTLTVNGVHSFTGNLLIHQGTLEVGDGTHDKVNPRNSALGDPLTSRKIIVYTNATLAITKTDIFGNARTSTADILSDLEIRGGTLTTKDSTCNEYGNVLFYDATASIGSNSSRWPAFMVSGDWLEFGSSTSTPFTLASKHGVRFGKRKPVDIRVPDITGDDESDVIFETFVNDEAKQDVNWDSPTNFVKTGAGTLQFSNPSSTFLRDAVISNGTLKLTEGKARIGNEASALGSTVIPHTIYVESAATLHFADSDLFGQFYNDPTGVCIHVRGGTLQQTAGLSNTFGPLVLEDANLLYDNGAWDSGTSSRWPTFAFSDVTFKGSTAYVFPVTNSAYFAFGMNGMGDMRVEKIVSDGTYSASTPDVEFDILIKDSIPSWSEYGPCRSTFRKTGPGVVFFNNAYNTFTGDVEIDDGVVKLKAKGTNNGYAPESGPLGNMATNRTITVCGSGELYYDSNDQLGQACADYEASFVISNGTVRFADNSINAWPTVKFYDANLIYGSGSNAGGRGEATYWGLWVFRYPVTFDGTKTLSLPSNGDRCIMSLGYSSDSTEEESDGLTYCHGRTEFCVKDMTSDACIDVDIGMGIQSLPYWSSDNNIAKPNHRYRCGLKKTGPGTLRIGGTFTCPKSTKIEEGALVFDGTLAEQQTDWGLSAFEVADGAFLGGTGTVYNVTVSEGGGFTSVLGQTGAMKIGGTLTLPESKNVALNIVCTNDLSSTGGTYLLPIVETTGLEDASFTLVYNGGEDVPEKYAMSTRVVDGVLYGRLAPVTGLVILCR